MGLVEHRCRLESIEALVSTVRGSATSGLELDQLAQACVCLADELTLLMREEGDVPQPTCSTICRELLIAMHRVAAKHPHKPRLPSASADGLALLQFIFDVIDWAGGPQTEPQIRAVAHTPRMSADEANAAVRAYLHEHHDASQREVARGVGCSVSTVGRTVAWRAVAEARREHAPGAPPRAVSLSDQMQTVLGDSDQVLEQLIDEQTRDERTDRVMAGERV